MIPAPLVRRLAALEALSQARAAPPPKGISALLAWVSAHPPLEDDDDDTPHPPTGLTRLVAEAKAFLKGYDHG